MVLIFFLTIFSNKGKKTLAPSHSSSLILVGTRKSRAVFRKELTVIIMETLFVFLNVQL